MFDWIRHHENIVVSLDPRIQFSPEDDNKRVFLLWDNIINAPISNLLSRKELKELMGETRYLNVDSDSQIGQLFLASNTAGINGKHLNSWDEIMILYRE
jgi:hypothetical protein